MKLHTKSCQRSNISELFVISSVRWFCLCWAIFSSVSGFLHWNGHLEEKSRNYNLIFGWNIMQKRMNLIFFFSFFFFIPRRGEKRIKHANYARTMSEKKTNGWTTRKGLNSNIPELCWFFNDAKKKHAQKIEIKKWMLFSNESNYIFQHSNFIPLTTDPNQYHLHHWWWRRDAKKILTESGIQKNTSLKFSTRSNWFSFYCQSHFDRLKIVNSVKLIIFCLVTCRRVALERLLKSQRATTLREKRLKIKLVFDAINWINQC